MKACFECKIALYNGCYCPACSGPLGDYNRDYIEDIISEDEDWTLALHEADLREVLRFATGRVITHTSVGDAGTTGGK